MKRAAEVAAPRSTEEVPPCVRVVDAWMATLPAFISTARALPDTALRHGGDASAYCDHLFTLFLLQEKRVLPRLPEESRAALREVARKWVGASSLSCAIRAASLLEFIGRPEDIPLLESHRPTDATLAAVFDEVAQALRDRA